MEDTVIPIESIKIIKEDEESYALVVLMCVFLIMLISSFYLAHTLAPQVIQEYL